MDFNWLVGRHCTAVEAPTEWATAFLFGDACLYVETLWRVTVDDRLDLTSNDQGQSYGRGAPVDVHARATALLVDRSITAVRADLRRGDLSIEFGSSHLLEIITDSHYEPWQLTAPGRDLVAASGGKVGNVSREV